MRIAYACFNPAAAFGLTGMALGVCMGATSDFGLAPAHAHVNLLGRVTLSLYGLYHRGVARERNRLAWAQVGCAAAGTPVMTGALAACLATGDGAFIPAAVLGSVLVLSGMALFLAVLLRDALESGAAAARRPALSRAL